MREKLSDPKRMFTKIAPVGVLAGSVLLGIGWIVYYVFKYHLMGALPIYDDCSYYYILGASGVMDGEYLPRFAHPGLNVMLVYGWFFGVLHALHILPVFSTAELLASGDPATAISTLFFWGRILSILLGICYLFLVYTAAKKISGSRLIGAVIALANLILVGLLEQMFVVRPELPSAIIILCGFLVCFEMNQARDFRWAMTWAVLAGVIIQNVFYSMVLMIFLCPLLLIGAPALTLDFGIDRKKYLISLFLLMALNILLIWPWWDLFRLSYLISFVPSQYASLFTRFFGMLKSVLMVAVGGGALFSGILCFNLRPGRFLNRVRNAVLLFLSTTGGFVLAFYLYILNGANERLMWAKQMIASATIETLNLVFFKSAFMERKPEWGMAFLDNLEVEFILGHMKIFLILFVIGFILSKRKERVTLLISMTVIYAFTLILETRGLKTAGYFYQIYFLIGFSMVSAVCLRLVSVFKSGNRNLSAIVLAFMLAVSMDCYKSAEYRGSLFSQHNNPALAISVLEYWGRDFHYERVLRPQYCKPGMDRPVCMSEIGHIFSELSRR